MVLNRKTIFEFAWRVAVVTLPWQTRFFIEARLAGWPWEQGSWSVYASWFPLLLAVVMFVLLPKASLVKGGVPPTGGTEGSLFRRNLFWLVATLGACTVIASPTPINAAAMWWIQITLLAAFFMTLLRADINPRKVAFWFIIALIPHALLAVMQFASQTVIGSSLLGMSAQHPIDLGVSVVQMGGVRFLRAYGGFPHPNILGGWMAVGLLVALILNPSPTAAPSPQPLSHKSRRGAFGEPLSLAWWGKGAGDRELFLVLAIEALFTLALFYSFSRSAWLAAAVGILVLSFLRMRESIPSVILGRSATETRGSIRPWIPDQVGDDKKRSGKAIWLTLAIPILLFATLSFIHRDLVLTRIDINASRLEQKSVTSRVQSLKDGVDVFKSNLLFGTGPNSELSALVNLRKITTSPSPPEPPHMVWLMMLVNFGIVGTLFIAGFGLYLLRGFLDAWKSLNTQNKIITSTLVICYLILGSFDHYPWSLWSGQSLSMVIFFICFTDSECLTEGLKSA